jgi:ubiquinone/menaquinone biosynthesis C-methylase UbiE
VVHYAASVPDRFTDIYANHGDEYHRLVRAEDVDRNLERLIARLVEGHPEVVEVGAGTGRITRILLEHGARVIAYDASAEMLRVAKAELAQHHDRVEFSVADARSLPSADRRADLAIAGWVFGHFQSWYPKRWHTEIARAVSELERVVRPGGTVVIIETFGTLTDGPAPPAELGEYYAWLEALGFRKTVVPTDYLFASAEEAAEVAGFFFGDDLRAEVVARKSPRIPEWTGVFVLSRRGNPP